VLRAASPAFALTAGNSAAIAEVCSRLDGMPLAIELAAARCPALGPAELAARLEGHLGLLSGGAARPGRHRSLESLVSWSYELLGDAERRLLARLSVLRGGFDLEVAERVAGGEPLAPQVVVGLLASLAGKSLVQIKAGQVIRYSLLETVRQFAADRLAASGEGQPYTCGCWNGCWARPCQRRRPWAAPSGGAGPIGFPRNTQTSAPRCPGRSAARSRTRAGNWPPG